MFVGNVLNVCRRVTVIPRDFDESTKVIFRIKNSLTIRRFIKLSRTKSNFFFEFLISTCSFREVKFEKIIYYSISLYYFISLFPHKYHPYSFHILRTISRLFLRAKLRKEENIKRKALARFKLTNTRAIHIILQIMSTISFVFHSMIVFLIFSYFLFVCLFVRSHWGFFLLFAVFSC